MAKPDRQQDKPVSPAPRPEDKTDRIMREIDDINERIGRIEKAQNEIAKGLNKISWHLFRRPAVEEKKDGP